MGERAVFLRYAPPIPPKADWGYGEIYFWWCGEERALNRLEGASESLFDGFALCMLQAKFIPVCIQKAIHGAYDNTTGLIIEADAFIAFIGVDDKIFVAHGNCADRAFVFAKAAIDTGLGDR